MWIQTFEYKQEKKWCYIVEKLSSIAVIRKNRSIFFIKKEYLFRVNIHVYRKASVLRMFVGCCHTATYIHILTFTYTNTHAQERIRTAKWLFWYKHFDYWIQLHLSSVDYVWRGLTRFEHSMIWCEWFWVHTCNENIANRDCRIQFNQFKQYTFESCY